MLLKLKDIIDIYYSKGYLSEPEMLEGIDTAISSLEQLEKQTPSDPSCKLLVSITLRYFISMGDTLK